MPYRPPITSRAQNTEGTRDLAAHDPAPSLADVMRQAEPPPDEKPDMPMLSMPANDRAMQVAMTHPLHAARAQAQLSRRRLEAFTQQTQETRREL